MSPFWGEFFRELRGRGRNATIFIIALGAVLVLTCIGVAIYSSELRIPIIVFTSGPMIFYVTVRWRRFRKLRARARLLQPLGPLSRDELRVARSKLTDGQT